MASKIKLRRGSAADWIAAYPVILSSGEPGYDTTNNKIKIGDGSSEWQALAYNNVLPAATTNDLGGVKLGDGFVLDGDDKVTTRKLYSTNESDPGQHYRLELTNGGTIKLPDQSEIIGSTLKGVAGTGGLNYTGMTIGPNVTYSEESWMYVDYNGAYIATKYNTDQQLWSFDNNGDLTLPADGRLISSTGFVLNAVSRGIITLGADIDGPEIDQHFHIAFPSSNVDAPYQDLILGDDLNYIKIRGYHDEQGHGVDIGSNDRASGLQHVWNFGTDGNLTLPAGSTINDSTGNSILGQSTAIVNSGNKLYINGSGDAVLDGPGGGVNRGLRWLYGSSVGGVDSLIRQNEDGLTIQSYSEGGEGDFYTNGSPIILRNGDQDPIDSWQFSQSNITLPAGGDILNSNGQSVLGQWSPFYADDLVLARGSTITDAELSIDIGMERPLDNTHWYNLFGELDPLTEGEGEAVINGGVCHDSGGNVYVLGSVLRSEGFDSDNLFLKYSPEGNLVWRRTWTDRSGFDCGSYNTSIRFLAEDVETGIQDTLVWSSTLPDQDVSYVGTMDTDGNLVDEFGNPRAPTRIENFQVSDTIWVDEASASLVAVVGHRTDSGNVIPAVAVVDLSTFSVIYVAYAEPDGIDLDGGEVGVLPWDNNFKSLVNVPAAGANPSYLATIGNYNDGSVSHAMVTISAGLAMATYGIGVTNYSEDTIIGEDVCTDNNGNVYIIVNNLSGGDGSSIYSRSVLIKGSISTLESENYLWQTNLGTDVSVFYATSIAYANGSVYVLGTMTDENNQSDAMLIKINEYTGNPVWQRRIGSQAIDGYVFYFNIPGAESSSGISIFDNNVVINFPTLDKTDISNGINIVTLQYPTDGSITGTYGDFVISDFNIGYSASDYSIDLLTTNYSNSYGDIVSEDARFIATSVTVDTGWENIRWDLDDNRQVYGPQTWKFKDDGSFDTKEISHLDRVKVTATTDVDVATWTFQSNNGLKFPDGSIQYGAFIETEFSMDGGSAVTVYNIPTRPTVVDGGGSSSRFGVNDPEYDGSNGNNYVLDGGGA